MTPAEFLASQARSEAPCRICESPEASRLLAELVREANGTPVGSKIAIAKWLKAETGIRWSHYTLCHHIGPHLEGCM